MFSIVEYRVCALSMPVVLISWQCELDSQGAFLSLASAPFGKVTQDCLLCFKSHEIPFYMSASS